MTAHEVRKYMSQCWRIRKELHAKYTAIAELRSMAEKMTSSFSQAPGGTPGNNSKVENYAIRIVEMQDEMADSTKQLLDVIDRTMEMIEMAPDPLQRAVLTEYHLNGKTAEKTAEVIGYSLSQTWRLMNEGYEVIAQKLTRNEIE